MTAASEARQTDQTGEFLRALFGPAFPDNCWGLVWSLVDKRSHWVKVPRLPGGADPYATDIYVGMGLVGKDVVDRCGERGRASAIDVCWIPGAWIDIDVAGEAHEKSNLPPDFETAWRILDECAYPPSLVVHTGGGLHAYWLVEGGLYFETEAEQREGRALVEGWQRHLMTVAHELGGYQLDSTYSLAQLLRVPGTLNHKYEVARDVTIERADGPIYNGVADLGAYAVAEPSSLNKTEGPAGGAVVEAQIEVSGAELTMDDMDSLRANLDDFDDMWYHRTPLGDGSLSAYDLSLANMAARAGFSDAKIADLIHHHRRYHQDPKDKGSREDYLRRTIAKAREGQVPMAAPESASKAEDREQLLALISSRLRMNIESIYHYTDDSWEFHLEEGQIPSPDDTGWVTTVEVGSSDTLMSPSRFHRVWFSQTQKMLDRFKQAQWDDVVAAISAVAEWRDLGAAADERRMVMDWLAQHFTHETPVIDCSDETLFHERRPYRHDENGPVFFFLSTFQEWILAYRNERTDSKHLGKVLRSLGCEPHREQGTNPRTGKKTVYNVWMIPRSLVADLGI